MDKFFMCDGVMITSHMMVNRTALGIFDLPVEETITHLKLLEAVIFWVFFFTQMVNRYRIIPQINMIIKIIIVCRLTSWLFIFFFSWGKAHLVGGDASKSNE